MLLKRHICPWLLLVTNSIQPFYRSWVTWNWWQLGHFLQTQQWGELLMNWTNCFLSLPSTAKQSWPNKLNPLFLRINQLFRESCLLANMPMDFKVKCPIQEQVPMDIDVARHVRGEESSGECQTPSRHQHVLDASSRHESWRHLVDSWPRPR